jgi:hypothetical protein
MAKAAIDPVVNKLAFLSTRRGVARKGGGNVHKCNLLLPRKHAMLLKSPLLRKRTLSFFLSIEFGQSADRLSKKERTDERKHHIILADCPLSTNERVGVSANIDKSLRYCKLLDMDSAYRYIPLFLGGTKNPELHPLQNL